MVFVRFKRFCCLGRYKGKFSFLFFLKANQVVLLNFFSLTAKSTVELKWGEVC